MVTYSDQGAGVDHGSFLLELAHDGCLDLLGGLGGGGGGSEKGRHCVMVGLGPVGRC